MCFMFLSLSLHGWAHGSVFCLEEDMAQNEINSIHGQQKRHGQGLRELGDW